MDFLSLNELCIGTGEYGLAASASKYSEQLPSYLRITDISDEGSIPQQLPTCVDTSKYPSWKDYLLHKGDIVFARTGNSTGRNFCLRDNREIVFAGFLIRFRPDFSKTIPGYIGYYCQSESYKKVISLLANGSTRKQLNAKQYGELIKIPVCSLDSQQHIVGTTSSLR